MIDFACRAASAAFQFLELSAAVSPRVGLSDLLLVLAIGATFVCGFACGCCAHGMWVDFLGAARCWVLLGDRGDEVGAPLSPGP